MCDHNHATPFDSFDGKRLLRCESCDLIFLETSRTEDEDRALYEDYYHNEIAGRFLFGVESVIRLFRLFRAFKIVSVCRRAKRILDVGSGRGFTLYYLRKFFGFTRTVGTQISRPAYEFSRNLLGLEIYDRDLLELDFEDESFDVVIMWHVLEHLREPESYVHRISKLLCKGGAFIVEVPNLNSWTRRMTGKYWLGLDLEHHRWFFTPESLTRLLERCGLTVEKVHTFSLEYSTFISAQSLISKATKSDHVFFRFLQNGGLTWRVFFRMALFLIIAPFCLIANLLLYFSKRGEVILIVARRG